MNKKYDDILLVHRPPYKGFVFPENTTSTETKPKDMNSQAILTEDKIIFLVEEIYKHFNHPENSGN